MSRPYRSYGPPTRTDQGRTRQQQHPQFSNSYPAEYADYYQNRRYQAVGTRNPGFVIGDLDEPNSDEEGAMLAERQPDRQERERQQREQVNRSSERPRDGHGSDRRHDGDSHGGHHDDRSSRHPPRASARDDSRDSHAHGRNSNNDWAGEKEFWRKS